jgi:hypothetical protein
MKAIQTVQIGKGNLGVGLYVAATAIGAWTLVSSPDLTSIYRLRHL